jgi:hypothetical protein
LGGEEDRKDLGTEPQCRTITYTIISLDKMECDVIKKITEDWQVFGVVSWWGIRHYLACKVFLQLIIHFPTLSGPFLPARDF